MAPVSITRCPACHTAFHVTSEELGLAGGKVRCGSCLQVFIAREQMVVEQKSLFDSTPVLASRTPRNEDENELPGAEYFVGGAPRAESPTAKGRPSIWLWTAICLLLLLALPAQLLLWQPQQFVRHAWYPAFLESACEPLGCEVRPIDHLQLMRVEGSVEGIDDRFLAAQVRMTNHSPLAQPLPNLLLQFRNLQGREVASRLFDPAEYLPASDRPQAEILEPRQSIAFRLELVDPGDEAVNYEFALFGVQVH